MWDRIPFQKGGDILITNPKLDSLLFGMAISNGIVAPLSSTKWVSSAKEGDAFMKEYFGLFLRFLCFVYETNIQVNANYLS